VLKSYVLYSTWGKLQGFDAPAWLETFRVTHWFEPLPAPRSLLASYHPPLSYLLTRVIFTAIPKEVEATQVLSTLAMLVAFFGFRKALREIGILESLAGMWLLYAGFSLPLYVWLATETGYDGVILAWFTLTICVSVSLFWQPVGGRVFRNVPVVLRLVALIILLVAGLYTKYSGLMSFVLPFAIILIRRGPGALARESYLPAAACVIAIAILTPFYYNRYYKGEHEWMPAAMEWQKSRELAVIRPKRDAAPREFLFHMLRIPSESISQAKRPVMDSFIHSIWFHTWKRDKWLGPQPEPSLSMSNVYAKYFAYLVLIGSTVFFVGPRRPSKEMNAWRQVGWLLLAVTIMFSISALAFAWRYPIWGWRVFKAKYMAPGILWIAFASWVPFGMVRTLLRGRLSRRIFDCVAYLALLAFMLVNHLLPVY
jgi:hypothetical protein